MTLCPAASDESVHGKAVQPPPVTETKAIPTGVLSVTTGAVAVDGPLLVMTME